MRGGIRDWIEWGRIDPLYGVATTAGRSRLERPWTEEEFYAQGAGWTSHYLPVWKRYGVNLESCVEVGCGAGRFTAQLARDFGVVHGVDVAPGQLEYARPHVPANVRLHLGDGARLPLADASVTAGFSVHVFQHFGRLSLAEANFAELYRTLAPGGTIMVHAPLVIWPFGWWAKLHQRAQRAARILSRLHWRLWRIAYRLRAVPRPPQEWLDFEVKTLAAMLARIGFEDVRFEILVLRGSAGPDPQAFVMARRPAPSS
jgi:SAM-dependent methyltransferase